MYVLPTLHTCYNVHVHTSTHSYIQTYTRIHSHMKKGTSNAQSSKCNNYHHVLSFCFGDLSRSFSEKLINFTCMLLQQKTAEYGVITTTTTVITTMVKPQKSAKIKKSSNQNTKLNTGHSSDWTKSQQTAKTLPHFLLLRSQKVKRPFVRFLFWKLKLVESKYPGLLTIKNGQKCQNKLIRTN